MFQLVGIGTGVPIGLRRRLKSAAPENAEGRHYSHMSPGRKTDPLKRDW